MDRSQTIRDYLTVFQYDWMKKKINECKLKILPCIRHEAEKVLLEVKEAQNLGDNRSLCFISLFHFRSSLWTGNYRYQICASDGSLYLSMPLATADFVPEQIYNDTAELKNAIEIELKKQFVRLTLFEMQSAIRIVLNDYQQLVEVYWSQVVESLADSNTFVAINKQENWKFLSGTYMDELRVILQSENRR